MKKATIKRYLRVLRIGCAAAGFVTLAAAEVAFCGLLLWLIPSESGWFAVLDFIVALFAACCAVFTLYICGAWIMKRTASK